MFIRGIGNAVKLAFVQIVRNRAMSFASLFSITAMLLVLGLFFILIVNVNMVTESAKKQFDTIQIYLAEETDRTDAQRMIQSLSGTKGVAKAWYLSKEEAMDEYRQKWGDKSYLLDGFQENPLPNSIRVKITDLELADSVVEAAKKLEGIEDIKYYRTAVDKLLAVTGYIKTGALAVIISLIAVSVVVVANTIKLTVLARAREISIMKYVGAGNWFIRGPFLVEGILIGLFSSVVSVLLVGLIYHKLAELFGNDILLIFSVVMVPESFLAANLLRIFMALGVSIGAFGSIISMRRFLDT
ncbi:MAG TPA: permease-like cell division protein FtsX [Bacillota bacterium]|jgi:cell division transport system permease protein|nr:permease-like cell division protein FtsX [Bacillota bacterium]